MHNESVELQTAELLAAIVENLDKGFFGTPKNEAKQHYQLLVRGHELPFMEISTSGQGDINCKLALDHSQFVGGLSFTRFRTALASHLKRIASALKNKEGLNIYTAEETGDIIYHIPGIVAVGDTLNILVTCVEQRLEGIVIIRLMFLDPDNFKNTDADHAATDG